MLAGHSYAKSARLLKPVQLAGIPLDRSTCSQLFAHMKKLGVDTFAFEQNLPLVDYLEELALSKPRSRTLQEIQHLAPDLQKLASDLIHLHPEFFDKYDLALGSGKTWYGFFERLWLSLPLDTQATLAVEHRAYAERERIFTTLPDREPCLHTLVWMDREPSLWQISWVEENQGGWVCVYTPVGENPEKLAILASRGTAPRWLAAGGIHSVINDLLPELGASAVQASWPHLSRFLEEEGIETVELGGKSLGGNMTQHFGCLIAQAGIHVRSMITFQSPGVCEAVHQAMLQIRKNDRRPLEVVDYLYGRMKGRVSDRTPQAGGLHLGHTLKDREGVTARKVLVSLDPDSKAPQAGPYSLFEGIAFLVGLVSSHVLRLGLVPDKVYLKTYPFESITQMGAIKGLEKIRRLVYFLLTGMTLGLFSRFNAKQSMESFIRSVPTRFFHEKKALAIDRGD